MPMCVDSNIIFHKNVITQVVYGVGNFLLNQMYISHIKFIQILLRTYIYMKPQL